jgi:hypothetical protein
VASSTSLPLTSKTQVRKASWSMPCWIYMRGDPDPIMSNDSPDVVMRRIEEADDGFITIAGMPYGRDDEPRTGYVRATDVTAVLAMHPRQYEADLDDPPDWYTHYASD